MPPSWLERVERWDPKSLVVLRAFRLYHQPRAEPVPVDAEELALSAPVAENNNNNDDDGDEHDSDDAQSSREQQDLDNEDADEDEEATIELPSTSGAKCFGVEPIHCEHGDAVGNALVVRSIGRTIAKRCCSGDV